MINFSKQRQNIDNDEVAFDVEKAPQFLHTTDERPLSHVPIVHSPPRKEVAHLAKLYDSFRTQDALFNIEDFEFHGTFTPTAGNLIQVALNLPQSPNFLLYRFPRATSLHIGVNTFSIAAQTTPNVIGSMEFIYVDPNGYPIHLGEYQTTVGNTRQRIYNFSKFPIVDTDNQSFGMLTIALNPGGASAVVYNYSISFSIGYLLPSDGFVNKCMICEHHEHSQYQEHEHHHINQSDDER